MSQLNMKYRNARIVWRGALRLARKIWRFAKVVLKLWSVYSNEPACDIGRGDGMFSDQGSSQKLTVLSYFTVCGLVGTTDTQMYVHKH